MKEKVAEKHYKNKELLLKLSPQLNMSLGCVGDLSSCVSLECLHFFLEELHYEKTCTVKGL